MDTFDFVIIGAGPAGEAAANEARSRDASVAIIDRLWFGGSCPFVGCLPSKTLLHAAFEHAGTRIATRWQRASERRDYMVNRAADAERARDASHVHAARGRRRGVLPRHRPDRSAKAGSGSDTTARRTRSPGGNVVGAVGSRRSPSPSRLYGVPDVDEP